MKRKSIKRMAVLAMTMVTVLSMMACGKESTDKASTDKADATETASEVVVASESGMTGTHVLSATSQENFGGTDCDVDTTLTVDYDNMKADFEVLVHMPLGDSVMDFIIIAKEGAFEGSGMNIGEAELVDNGDGTYNANFNFDYTAEDGTATPMDYTIVVNASEAGCTADVDFEGVFAGTVSLTE